MIIVLGLAGSGKSTQSQLLAARSGKSWLSMGALLRDTITDERREVMLAGKVLDEQDTINILQQELMKRGDTPEIILDGFPRGVLQAQWLVGQHIEGDLQIRVVIHLKAHVDPVRLRLRARGRQDDTDAAISERFQEYEDTIKPIITLFSDNNISVLAINAEQPPKEVEKDIMAALKDAGIAV